MKLYRQIVAAVFTLLALSANVSATVLTFDDLPSTTVNMLATNYGGLTWANAGFLDGALRGDAYAAAIVSANNVLFPYGSQQVRVSSLDTFTLNSAFFTAIWQNEISLVFHGYDNGTLVNSAAWVVGRSPTLLSFNWNIDTLTIDTYIVGSTNDRTWFGLDNFAFNEQANDVPAPTSVLLLGLGLMGLGLRRKAASAS